MALDRGRRPQAWHRAVLVLLGALLPLSATAEDPAAQPTPEPTLSAENPRSEWRLALSLGNETSGATGAAADVPSVSNLALAQPSIAYRHGDRWRAAGSFVGLLDTYGETRGRVRVRETYVSLSAGDLDLAAGKKLLRWGTGYAFTPTGILDPPRRPTDATDRLNLNEGRELLMANWIRGPHSLTAALASAGILEHPRPGMYATAALRYNALVAGFDASLIYAHARHSIDFYGLNFTRVIGSRLEVHGEAAWRVGTEEVALPGLTQPVALADTSRVAALLGGKYTLGAGVTAIFELYSADGLIPVAGAEFSVAGAGGAPTGLQVSTERRHYALVTANKARLRELPGWRDWDLAATALVNLSDGSLIAVLDAERRLGLRYAAHLRVTTPAGARSRSEYGMIPYTTQVSIGLRFQM